MRLSQAQSSQSKTETNISRGDAEFAEKSSMKSFNTEDADLPGSTRIVQIAGSGPKKKSPAKIYGCGVPLALLTTRPPAAAVRV